MKTLLKRVKAIEAKLIPQETLLRVFFEGDDGLLHSGDLALDDAGLEDWEKKHQRTRVFRVGFV